MESVNYKPRERNCIYCDSRANSLEHVIPKWIPRHFGLSGEVMTHDRAIGMNRWQGARFGDFAARIYCDPHHRQINRVIENKPTRDLIKKLFPGDAEVLNPDEQMRLAAWAAKTCYAQWGMVRRRWGVPLVHRRHLIETGEPHPSVFVSISHCTGDRVRIIFARTEVTSPKGMIGHYYDFVLAIGQIAFKVWGPTKRVREVAYKAPTSFATRVAPNQESVARWPPGRVLDDDGVTELWDYDPRAGKASKERR
jgi:hypothetical protein